MKKLLTTSLLTFALGISVSVYAGKTTPKREFRSTWFTTHVNIDWPQRKGTSADVINSQKESMVEYIEGFERMNLNGACFQVRAQCDALYKSSYEPWSAVITGTRGKDPGWDPLQYCIDECHKRGLECYAWINPFRWSTGTDYSTPQDIEFKQKGWILSYDGYYVLNPAIPEAREHILKVCREIVTNYAIDGVLFDDYFYPNNIPENSAAGDWSLYKASGTTLSIGDWRRENINIFVREFKAMIEDVHPDMRFGISPAGIAGKSASKFGVDPVPSTVKSSDWQYNTIYSDPLAWLAEGSIDFISPQIYWQTYHTTAPYEPLCDWWTYVADKFGRHFYSSKNVYFFTSANNTSSWNEVATQVKLDRQYAEPTKLNAPGTIYYSSKYFYGPALSGLGDYLLNNANQTKALVPVVGWKKTPTYGAPKDLKLNGTKLTWTKIDAPKSIMRYTIYAVPENMTLEEATDESGDGISNDYLLKVCYDNSFTLPAEAQGKFWYAVCAYDGAGNEFEPAVVNYPQGSSAKVTLSSPADGATIDWISTFSWSAVNSAEYVLRIASDVDFSDIVYTSDRLTANTLDNPYAALKPQAKYYWNVTCYETGKLGTASDTRSFNTKAYADAPKVTLLTPADGATVEGNINFSWTTDKEAAEYTLEIAKDATFPDVRYTTTITTGEVRVAPSLIGKGKYYWRVKTDGPLLNSTPSAVRTFTIESLAIGEYEPGYTIKKDPATYPIVDGIQVENLWMRAVTSDFENISFLDNGMMERSMVAVGDFVYLTRRSENTQGAVITLEKYDGLTGEHICSITLGDEGKVPLYPNNSVTKDDADNVIVSNLTTNAVETPLYVHLVDLNTGALKEVAKVTLTGLAKARVDHVAVTGNVVEGNFDLYFAVASDSYLIHITYSGGVEKDRKLIKLDTTTGIAANVTPISDSEVLVNGGGTPLLRFNLADGKTIEKLDKNTTANGSARVQLDKYYYTVYPESDYSSKFTFNIDRADTPNLADAKTIVTLPENGLGNINSSTSSTPISIVKDDERSARVYVYAVGNGISAYKVSETTTSVSDGPINVLTANISGNVVTFSRPISAVRVYTASGALVSVKATTCATISLPTTPGVYIVNADNNTFRFIVR